VKIPLIHQPHQGCVPTSIINCLYWLRDADLIPGVLIQRIYAVSMDNFNQRLHFDNKGTSSHALFYCAMFLDSIENNHLAFDFCEYKEGSEVNQKVIDKGLAKNGCTIALVNWGQEMHSVLITGEDKTNGEYRVFDPHYRTTLRKHSGYRIPDKINPFGCNLLVSKTYFFESNAKFALPEEVNREIVVIGGRK
jgi:hypothetical protein